MIKSLVITQKYFFLNIEIQKYHIINYNIFIEIYNI